LCGPEIKNDFRFEDEIFCLREELAATVLRFETAISDWESTANR